MFSAQNRIFTGVKYIFFFKTKRLKHCRKPIILTSAGLAISSSQLFLSEFIVKSISDDHSAALQSLQQKLFCGLHSL